jgi:hypothetical protein
MLILACAPKCKIVKPRNLVLRTVATNLASGADRGRAKEMVRKFIDEKWPELMVVLGLGMSCMALVVPLL